MDVNEAFQKLNNLDVEDLKKIGTAPKPVKLSVIALLAVVIIAAMGWFLVKPELEARERAERKEQELRDQFEIVQKKAASLPAYRAQLAEMEESFGALLRQLPNETDMESLLIDLSQTSVAAGLDVEYFKPGQEQKLEFYAEHPIELRVTGTYHEFGRFVSGLAALPRIVTLHNIQITPTGSRDEEATAGSAELNMELTAKTYRYLSDEEAAAASRGDDKGGKRKK
ncbi:MAG: type 4a pilus biogenesis protein PilO [Halofilum sp. (in: g-proteobacteria)]|nr:type 4a pilus biogenesis protein PilO [Halofilum sp. (in: g-proteobacteria)]